MKNQTKIQKHHENVTVEVYDFRFPQTMANKTRTNEAKIYTVTAPPEGIENKEANDPTN